MQYHLQDCICLSMFVVLVSILSLCCEHPRNIDVLFSMILSSFQINKD